MARSSPSSPLMPDLFGAGTLPGLETMPDIMSPAEEATLTGLIDAVPLAPFRFQGWTGKRLTASFGWRYDFDNARFAEAEPLPDWLLPLRERAAALAGLRPDALPHALLTRYDPGAGIGWHRDRPVFEHVVGVSLGAAAVMRFRRRTETGFERRMLPLAPRSAYHLVGEARHDWEHNIAPLDQTRWSITFRSLRG
jgi:DNA oxidative demethylase